MQEAAKISGYNSSNQDRTDLNQMPRHK